MPLRPALKGSSCSGVWSLFTGASSRLPELASSVACEGSPGGGATVTGGGADAVRRRPGPMRTVDDVVPRSPEEGPMALAGDQIRLNRDQLVGLEHATKRGIGNNQCAPGTNLIAHGDRRRLTGLVHPQHPHAMVASEVRTGIGWDDELHLVRSIVPPNVRVRHSASARLGLSAAQMAIAARTVPTVIKCPPHRYPRPSVMSNRVSFPWEPNLARRRFDRYLPGHCYRSYSLHATAMGTTNPTLLPPDGYWKPRNSGKWAGREEI